MGEPSPSHPDLPGVASVSQYENRKQLQGQRSLLGPTTGAWTTKVRTNTGVYEHHLLLRYVRAPFVYVFACFEMGFFCVTLAVPELYTRLP